MKFQTPYAENKAKSTIKKFEKSITEQSHKDELSMERILSKYHHSLSQEHRLENRGMYGFASSATLQEALDIVHTARDMFDELPAPLRQKFGHDPANFLEYVQNPENAQEMVKYGLATSTDDIPSAVEQLVSYTIEKIQQPDTGEIDTGETGGTS